MEEMHESSCIALLQENTGIYFAIFSKSYII